MARLARYTQQTFGTTAGASQMAEFGSLAAGSPATYTGATITPTIVQTLSQFASGWFAAIQGANSPAIEDMNALFYLAFYQLSYIMQLGVPEWDTGTTYYLGSVVQDGTGILYRSLTNSNLGNALSSTANWQNISSGENLVAIDNSASPYTVLAGDNGKTFLFNSANGPLQMNLPAPSPNFNIRVVDVAGAISFYANNLTFHRNAAELFEGLAADYLGTAPWGTWNVATIGTNWILQG